MLLESTDPSYDISWRGLALAHLNLDTFKNINYIPDVFFCLASAGGGAGSNRSNNFGGGGGGAFYDFVLSLKALQESSNYEYLFVNLGSGGKTNT